MRRSLGATLAMMVALGGCSSWNQATSWGDRVTASGTDKVAQAGANIGLPWGSQRPGRPPDDSLTVARVMGPVPTVGPLTTETGNVWPAAEGPRATLANPEAALRGIPNYRSEGSGGAMTAQPAAAQPNPRRRGSSSPPPPSPVAMPQSPPPLAAQPPTFEEPTPRRADGRIINTPRGPVTTTGGTDRIQSYVTPGGGTGTAIRDGNVTTLIGPDGQVRSVLTPR